MRRLSNLKLKTKAIINSAALIIATSFLAFVSLIGIYSVQKAAKVSATYYSAIVDSAITINNDFVVSTNDYRAYLKNPNQTNIENFRKQLEALQEHFNKLMELVGSDNRAEMIAVSINDFKDELKLYSESSLSLLNFQKIITESRQSMSESIEIFLRDATKFLDSIYNNILTAENPNLERRIPRVKNMVAIIDGMKNALLQY